MEIKRVNLVDIGSRAYDVLGTIYNQLGAEPIQVDLKNNAATVNLCLFTTAQEENPSNPKTLVLTGADFAALGFNVNALLAILKRDLHLPTT